MQSDSARRMGGIQEDVRAAEAWRAKGNLVRASTSNDSAAWGAIAVAVRESANIGEMRRCVSWDLVYMVVRQCLQAKLDVAGLVDAGKQPGSVLGGCTIGTDLAHFCSAAGEMELARQYAQLSVHPESLAISTPFWREYAKVHWALWTGTVCQPNLPEKLRPMERYWSVYLELMAHALEGRDIEPAVLKARESFAERNTDRSLTYDDDAYGTEGIGLAPVRWDYRLDGILALVEHGKRGAMR